MERGHDIESRYLSSHVYEPGDVSYVGGANTELLLTPDGVEFRRRLVSNVFRASAKVYLHSVISGGFPESEWCLRIGVGTQADVADMNSSRDCERRTGDDYVPQGGPGLQ